MIVIDTSALIAILQDEPERPRFAAVIARANRRMVSAVSLLEAGIVVRIRRGEVGLVALDEMVSDAELDIVAFDDTQRRLALQAFNQYGKGIHPSARLNFGDCAAYALAKIMNAPLLFKGTDFVATDLISAVA